MKTLKILLFLILLLLVGLGVFVASGTYNFAADDKHWALTESLIGYARHRSVDQRAAGIVVPDDLGDPQRLARGANHYQSMCSGCHLVPGRDASELRDGLYPRPPNLAEHGIHDPQSAFWVIKHGIKMSGMPAWGKSHDDQSLWDVVALLRQLPELSEQDWQALTGEDSADVAPHGHGDNGHHHSH